MLKGEKPRVCLRPVVVSNSREYVFLKTPALSTSEESKDRKLTHRSKLCCFQKQPFTGDLQKSCSENFWKCERSFFDKVKGRSFATLL